MKKTWREDPKGSVEHYQEKQHTLVKVPGGEEREGRIIIKPKKEYWKQQDRSD